MSFMRTAAVASLGVVALAAGGAHVSAQIRAAERAPDELAAAESACFGAAARDRARPCEDRGLRLTVVPAPSRARDELIAPCRHFRREGGVNVCAFGVGRGVAIRTIALAGDSHAAHWRVALDVVARARAWRGLSMTRRSCPLSTATRVIPEPELTRCLRWNRALPLFLREHPEIDTLLVSALTSGKVIVPAGATMFESRVNGHSNAWEAVPPTVRHIVVIRDTPRMASGTLDCVERAIAARRRAGLACAIARRRALAVDPAAVAAHRLDSDRVQVADLTPTLCSSRLCYPVIGGALVFKDTHHLTRVVAETLGPLLGRELDRLGVGWGP